MDNIRDQIRIAYTDEVINEKLASIVPRQVPYTRHFSQEEDFFIKLPESFPVPSYPIHHDVRNPVPSPEYLDGIRALVHHLAGLVPDVFRGLTYIFDPAEIQRPAFFRLYRYEETDYLYILRIDLQWRPREHALLQKGGNDLTSSYRSEKLYLEADFIPLESVIREEDGGIRGFRIRRSISQTWVGERGRGYFIQGIWIDGEITKFFTRLFLPRGKRLYPYYPFTCKHRAVCFAAADPGMEKRKEFIPLLHRSRLFLEPRIPVIEEALKNAAFSENLETFTALKEEIPDEWYRTWESINLRAYLNKDDMKEYQIEF